MFNRTQNRKDITIASETMDLSIHPPGDEGIKPPQDSREQAKAKNELKNRALQQMRQQDEQDNQNAQREEDRARDKKRPAA